MFSDAARSLDAAGLVCGVNRTKTGTTRNVKINVKHKNKYRRLRNNNNLQQLRQTGKDYKNEINKAVTKYKQQVIHKIQKIKSENPRDYWNIINNKNNYI